MANEATERFLRNVPRIILSILSFLSGFSISTETIEINGWNIPVSFKDFPEVFKCAFIFFVIAYITGFWSTIFFFMEGIFTKFLRWCCIVSFALAVCLLFICRLISAATLIGSDSDWTYEKL